MPQLDTNHREIVLAAQSLGIMVVDNAQVKRAEPGQLDTWWGITNPNTGYGVWVWVEIKFEAGRLSPAQIENIQDCLSAGLPTEVVRTVDDVIRVHKKYSV